MSMTSRSPDIERIRSRREEIAREIKDAKLRVSSLTAEDQELEIAERVILRLSGVAGAVSSSMSSIRQPAISASKESETAGKPEGTPTVPEMIIEALKFAKLRGKSGLGSKGMTEFIATKWWPEVTINNVGPIAWRMWRRKQLAKKGGIYSLPENEAPDPKESGARDHIGDGGGTPTSSGSNASDSSLAAPPGASPAHPGE